MQNVFRETGGNQGSMLDQVSATTETMIGLYLAQFSTITQDLLIQVLSKTTKSTISDIFRGEYACDRVMAGGSEPLDTKHGQ